MNEEFGRPAMRRRMALWHVGRPVDRRELARAAGLVPRAVGRGRETCPVLHYLRCEEGRQHMPDGSWLAVLRLLRDRGIWALEAGVPWYELVRWGWPAEQALALWERVRAARVTTPPPGTTPEEVPLRPDAETEINALLDGLF